MREIDIGTKRYTKVICTDEPGAGGACHNYRIERCVDEFTNAPVFAEISFQNGAILESGINGCHNEDLIAVLLDRLNGFQSGEFKCWQNELAIMKLREALHWLNNRTAERQARGVEGKLVL
jgi:hypothetical protein